MAGRVADHGGGQEHGDGRGRLDDFHLVRPAAHQRKDVQHAVAALAVVAVHGPIDVGGAEGEVGLPTADLGPAPGGVVEVYVVGLLQRAVDVCAQGHALVGQLRILARGVGPGLDDPLLHVADLQGVGVGVLAAAHEVGEGQHGPHQDLLVILAGVGGVGVVGEHRAGLLGQAGLRVVVQGVADLAEELLGFLGPARRQLRHGPIHLAALGLAAVLPRILVQLDRGRLDVAGIILAADLAQAIGMAGTAGQAD